METQVENAVIKEVEEQEEVVANEATVFAEIIKKLNEANSKIAVYEKTKEKLLSSKMKPEEKQAKLMAVYNEAILAFNKLPREIERAFKTQKMSMWRSKEFAVKKFY